MRAFARLMLMLMLAGLSLAACGPTSIPMDQSVVMPNGAVYNPPPGGWSNYMSGGGG